MKKKQPKWKPIKMGERLPCWSFIRKMDGTVLPLTTIGGAFSRQEAYYLPVKDVIEIIKDFPKEESEGEKIRKALLEMVYETTGDSLWVDYNVHKEDALAWLEKQGQTFTKKDVDDAYLRGISDAKHEIEKQGEQKHQYKSRPRYVGETELLGEQNHTDKVEPKFKVGDWVVNKFGDVWHIDSFDKKNYQVSNGDKYNYFPISKQNEIHLWTIQDAKDGDVLEFKDHGRLVVGIVSYINKSTGKVDVYCLLEDNNFKVGNYYALDTINPHPATKEQRDTLFEGMKEAGYEWDAEKKELKKIEQKPANWYQELEDKLANATPKQLAEWKEKYFKEEPAEWSEEDKPEDYKDLIEQLQSLMFEWSNKKDNMGTCINKHLKKIVSSIKSLEDRVQPQSSWKPSKEQIMGIDCAIKTLRHQLNVGDKRLNSLYDDLKKLGEE